MPGRRETLSCGRSYHAVPDMQDALGESHDAGFDFLSVPLCHPRYRRTFGSGAPTRAGLFTRSDMVLKGSDWSRFVVGRVSDWVDLNSAITSERKHSEKAFKQELGWASHLNLPAVQIPLTSYNCANMATTLNGFVGPQCNALYWITVPLVAPVPPGTDASSGGASSNGGSADASAAAAGGGGGADASAAGPAREYDTWEWWNRLRTLTRPTTKLAVALELTADLPTQPEAVARWLGEPVRAVIVPTSIFLINSKGYPVLSKPHQAVVKRILKYDPQFMLKGNVPSGKNIAQYYNYLQHLHKTQPELGPVEKFAVGYEDYLQSPLQPLMDNLESQTYETFEKDPIKYQQYQLAVKLALLDRVPEAERSSKITVMVVGAGRGPLVQCALEAAKEAGCKVKMFAVEKNPNAVVTLEARNANQWGGVVTVVSTDMRAWKTEVRADIMVSELLGSFADNELSPECLDGAQAFLAEDGISIPYDSSSFMAPLAAHKLHTELMTSHDKVKQLQTPFVVMLHNVYRLTDVKKVFEFVHPNPENDLPEGPDNSRYEVLEWEVEQAGTMHGFAGYFESRLYKDVMISINPATHSPGMFSWFPIYFPIQSPIYVPAGGKVEAHIWRKSDGKKVWYEWCVTSPVTSPMHNVNGSSYYIGL